MSHVCDKYCNALQEAKSRIEKLPCPAGLPDWLRVNEASLYRVYFVDWPAKIEEAWKGRYPLREFKETLKQWKTSYRECLAAFERENKEKEN